MSDGQHILIAGAGIAGLGLALAFKDSAYRLTLLDRDPPPPDESPEQAFAHWQRRGVTQLRHSHVFLGRLTTLLRARYPDLLEELLAAGARIFRFADGLPLRLQPNYIPASGDEEMDILFSRRTTLELVMRRYAARLPNIRLETNVGVRGLLLHRDGSSIVADGLRAERNGVIAELRGDIIVDASGRGSPFPDWLRAEGIAIAEERKPTGILYFTRHYRLRDGAEEPPRDGTPGAGDLGYIKYGVFNADSRHFSITLALPEIENELRRVILKPEKFDQICTRIPGCARWTDPACSEPVTPIFAMGNLTSVWRSTLRDNQPQILNYFAVGDSELHTNPLYGRGCSAGMVQAHLLREVFDDTSDPRERARRYEAMTRAALRPFFDSMVRQDASAIRRAEQARDPNHKPRLRGRIARSLAEDAIVPATRGNMRAMRSFSRSFHMVEHPNAWLTQPDVLAAIARYWAMPKTKKQQSGLYPPQLGPERSEMLAGLGLAA